MAVRALRFRQTFEAALRPVEPAAVRAGQLAREREHAVAGGSDIAMAAHAECRFLVRLGAQLAVLVLDEALQEPALPVVDTVIVLPVDRERARRGLGLLGHFERSVRLEILVREPTHLLRVPELLHARCHCDLAVLDVQVAQAVQELCLEGEQPNRDREAGAVLNLTCFADVVKTCASVLAGLELDLLRVSQLPVEIEVHAIPCFIDVDRDTAARDQDLDQREVDRFDHVVEGALCVLAQRRRQAHQDVAAGAVGGKERPWQRCVGKGAPARLASIGGVIVALCVEAVVGVRNEAVPLCIRVSVPRFRQRHQLLREHDLAGAAEIVVFAHVRQELVIADRRCPVDGWREQVRPRIVRRERRQLPG
ncbi:MAG TPA: hypothetical protein VFX59_27865 [Polyangiales bacterium]|nr:hypothetical protein [Polyangiales bacterium]